MGIEVLVISFFLVALLYSSVGFGGGSSYIALLLLAGVGFEEMRFTALTCNIVVVAGSAFMYYRKKMILWHKIWPLLVFSIPAAFLGGRIRIDNDIYRNITAIALILAACFMYVQKSEGKSNQTNWSSSLMGLMGGIVGFAAGFIGIGGGIFLSPLLYLGRWNTAKLISATACIFIFFNSVSGLIGHVTAIENMKWTPMIYLLLAVGLGGQIGNRLNIYGLKPIFIRYLTAALILFVGCRVLILNWI